MELALNPQAVEASAVNLEGGGWWSWSIRTQGRAWSCWSAGTEPPFSGKDLRKAVFALEAVSGSKNFKPPERNWRAGSSRKGATSESKRWGMKSLTLLFGTRLFYTQEARLHP